MFYKFYLLLSMTFLSWHTQAQRLEVLTSGEAVSLRGMSVVSDEIIWVSGSRGKVGRSINGGRSWTWLQVPGYEKRDFRDIEAIDSNTAIILAIAEPGAILKTIDGGRSWNTVYADSSKGIFMDAFHFEGRRGTVIGDPLDGTVYLAATTDFGDTWRRIPNTPAVDTGEACFASSGTNIVTLSTGGYLFATGGRAARLNYQGKFYPLPLLQGKESTGANSVAVFGSRAVVVGGDFANDTISTGNAALIRLGNVPTIKVPVTPPHGYRSSVAYMTRSTLIACGTSGVDISTDDGQNWQLISKDGYHVCQKAKKGKAVFLAGSNGRIARYFP
jgi:photosystem II stability/assembly factor-like uncharacterized protein